MMTKESLQRAFKRPFTDSKDNWKACCPFHDERTPSFLIHKEYGIVHCFGCGIGGSVDSAAANYLGVSKAKAREILDFTLEDSLRRGEASARKDASGSSYRAQRISFPESWLAPWKLQVHRYVLARGLTREVLQAAESRYDPALKRQVFPHRDRAGKLLGAVGRSCAAEDPKWLFYWDYAKGSALYRPFRSELDSRLIVVEGVFDLLWLYQNDIKSVAATLGTSFTAPQVQELRGLGVDEILIGFDRDDAGATSSEALYRVLRRGSRVRKIELPEFANDWMDLSREQIHDVIDNAPNKVSKALR